MCKTVLLNTILSIKYLFYVEGEARKPFDVVKKKCEIFKSYPDSLQMPRHNVFVGALIAVSGNYNWQ